MSRPSIRAAGRPIRAASGAMRGGGHVPSPGLPGGATAALRITIAGDIGSGKTTVARLLSRQVGAPWLSTGAIQRKMAAARGVSVLQLNKMAECDPGIDRAIDRR